VYVLLGIVGCESTAAFWPGAFRGRLVVEYGSAIHCVSAVKTITFYSYKGGVGRTLLLANVAKYLCRFGQRVFALDFDLEAPGLHYKLTPEFPEAGNRLGVVDYIYSFAVENRPRPDSLRDYVTEVDRNDMLGGLIHLMPAGNVPTAEYWRHLARIDWHDLFNSEQARGVPFFLELKAQIEKEFAPDYLLIDSRTGLTEIGGVATTVLPDAIVCLLLNSRENLDGAREVLRGICRTRRLRDQGPVETLPVVARLLASGDSSEAEILETVRTFLNEDAPDIEDNLCFSRMLALHTEPRLEAEESLLLGSGASFDSPLFRDYIHLFARLVPAEVMMPHLLPLVERAKSDFLGHPEKAEKYLAGLCEYASVPEPHRALLNFYFDTKADKRKILDAAHRYWSMTGRADDPLLFRAIHDCRSLLPEAVSLWGIPLDLIEAVWRSHGASDTAIGTFLANAYLFAGQSEMACGAVASLMENGDPSESEIAQWLEVLVRVGNAPLSKDLIARYKDRILGDREPGDAFWQAWAGAVGERRHETADSRKQAGARPMLDPARLADYFEILVEEGTPDPRQEIADLLRQLAPYSNLFLNPSAAERFWRMIDGMRLEPELREALCGRMTEEEAMRYIRGARILGAGPQTSSGSLRRVPPLTPPSRSA
jgi:hypothetical protein